MNSLTKDNIGLIRVTLTWHSAPYISLNRSIISVGLPFNPFPNLLLVGICKSLGYDRKMCNCFRSRHTDTANLDEDGAAAVARWWWQLTFRRQCGLATGRFTRVRNRPLPTCGHIVFWRASFWRENTRSEKFVFFGGFSEYEFLTIFCSFCNIENQKYAFNLILKHFWVSNKVEIFPYA